MNYRNNFAARLVSLLFFCAVAASTQAEQSSGRFTIAVVPDTQNYLDFNHQTAAGFPFDAREIFFEQMRYIARNARSAGGEIEFATAVGDVWQHPTKAMDEAHASLGLAAVPNPLLDAHLAPDPRTVTIEMANARRGYELIAGKLPFSVVPGNHDYDANWTDSRFPPAQDYRNPGDNKFPFGQLHYGGLDNFVSVFGSASAFFKDKDWYVASYNGGADSAQIFSAGGYRFLHIGLEMAPHDDVIRWAEGVLKSRPGLPTILTIHDHLSVKGERKPIAAVDFKAVHPEHNDPEDLWRKLISRHDQIFLVLSGHQHGQGRRVDSNAAGHEVYQILADYQDRNRTLADAGVETGGRGKGIGDGWLRLMRFDMTGKTPTIAVSTYSTFYKATAAKLPRYAAFYKAHEKPDLTDAAFIAEDEFVLDLADFKARFATARVR